MTFTTDEFYEFDKANAILLNSVISYLFIEFKAGIFTAFLILDLPHQSDYKKIEIKIEGISEININQNVESIGQQIHNYKFLINNSSYYLSLDPDESSNEVSLLDQDVFVFSSINAKL